MGELETGTPCLVPDSVAVCPRKLIRLCGEDLTPEALVAKIEKNVDILNMSGGGVTFSGGEPLAQAEFVEACMRLLRGKTNRALQTSGYCRPDVFSRVLRECDFVLYDLKLIDDAMHRRYTGVSNEQILENYRTLAASCVPFITRIPLIPGVNDTEENTRAMAALMQACGVGQLEVLPYNKMAGGKYLMLGRKYEPGFDGSVEPTVREEIFSEYGIEVRVL
jgi:pyruvate formate lyase activating enzyme